MTLATYSLILANAVYLFLEFWIGTKMEVITQINDVDRSITPSKYLTDNSFEVVMMSYPPLTPDIGKFELRQKMDCAYYQDDPTE